MEINLQSVGVTLPRSLPGAGSADLPIAVKTSDSSDAIAAASPGNDQKPADTLAHAEMRREAAVRQAAQGFFKDVYAVSDQTFTIYKDMSGQYITRYTSLRDGKVTYIPEPDMLAYMDRKRQAREAMVEIRV